MELSEAGPYLISGVVALVTALMTHKRANKAHTDTVVIDQQKLINETYQAVLDQLRSEMSRRRDLHVIERGEWEEREEDLKRQVSELRDKVRELRDHVSQLSRRGDVTSDAQDHHLRDSHRHSERRAAPRLPEQNPGDDLPL